MNTVSGTVNVRDIRHPGSIPVVSVIFRGTALFVESGILKIGTGINPIFQMKESGILESGMVEKPES